MTAPHISPEVFASLAPTTLNQLEAYGFRRATDQEEITSTFATIVFIGEHVGFVFSFDVRDQCVDAQVVLVEDGKIRERYQGGYSSSLFTYLQRHTGYRGGVKHGAAPAAGAQTLQSEVHRLVQSQLDLLLQYGQALLSDPPDWTPG